MKKPRFSLTTINADRELMSLVEETDQRILAAWARDCAERVMPYFEDAVPHDRRPRDVGEDSPARSAARAAGQAVATAHVRTHAPGAAIYAQQAIHRAATPEDAASAVAAERAWQITRLRELKQRDSGI